MATTSKALNDALRNQYLELLIEFFEARDEEVLRTASNEICIPCLDEDGNEKWVQFVIKVPKGSRDGDEFDGYAMREEFTMKQKEKEEKAKADAEKKARKIERDKQAREARKKAKEMEE
jgi:hypothetical protein